jgi:phage terminase large subunit
MRTNSGSFHLKLQRSIRDIHYYAREMLLTTPTWQQAELLDLVQWETYAPIELTKKGIAVKSGQGPGKTTAAAIAASWRLLQGHNNFVVVTSPTRRQVEDIFVSELQRLVSRSPIEFQNMLDIQKSRVRVANFPTWQLVTATAVRPENIQGYHHHSMTVVVDEASGIERRIWGTIKGTLTQPGNLLLAIGNPNDRETEFFDMFNKDAPLYSLLTWNAEQSPNVDKKHVEKMAAEYGIHSDTYRVRVLGEFPNESPNAVIRYEDLLWACRHQTFSTLFRVIAPKERSNVRQVGIDLARFGSDESVVVFRYNSAMVKILHFAKCEPADVIRTAFGVQQELGWPNDSVVYCVDAGGMGQGVMHLFRDSGRRWYEFSSGGTAQDSHMFHDAITEAYFNLREMTRKKNIFLHEDPLLFSQLISRQYRYDNDNKFRLETKDEYMKRVGAEEFTSPDRADAAALAWYPHAASALDVYR